MTVNIPDRLQYHWLHWKRCYSRNSVENVGSRSNLK